MSDETQLRAARLRAARAYLGTSQEDAAKEGGVAWNTLIAAERGDRMTDRTYEKMENYYRTKGVRFAVGDSIFAMVVDGQ